ncbi:DUF2913 family protein [Pseudoalteromonas denitrificans]|uniref:DUF2913 family protein n=1 Tax=Pseudoalteromonas denitrificans DSM 6059 TaxID=1123010 RepID=A0A1I1RHJ1_9GAMM|nr:DUF2913 family protein [Pseudoalteromonas denitrificans]SFD31718.1 Protein of unknown function [Pseudoalteromonas denitrificans DSM 6059]
MENYKKSINDMSWCGLVSLAIAQQNGDCGFNAMQENKFLSMWLHSAYKQKRFPKAIAPDLEHLMKIAKSKGQFAQLKSLLNELYQNAE